MNSVIVCCSCSGIKERSISAFSILYPDDEVPDMHVSSNAIKKLAASFPQDSNMAKHLDAISKKSGQYSYYIEYNEDMDITKMVNLLNGKDVY